MSLLPNPLHPAVVHLPVALAVLVPLVAAGSLWMIRHGSAPRVAWGVATAALAALVGSAWLALETGQQQEERVENVVSEQVIGAHEEAAETFLAISSGVLVISMLGFVNGRAGTAGRALGSMGTLAVLAAGWNVGRSGGELVYQHGAASAYAVTARAAVESDGVLSPTPPRSEQEESRDGR